MNSKHNSALQGIYAVFVGLALVAFFGIGLATFYPQPHQPDNMSWEQYQPAYQQWSVYTSVILLAFAIVTLVVALFWAYRISVLANGLLLGGLFTLFYAVFFAVDSGNSVLRFTMVTVALALAILVGWYRFSGKGSHSTDTAAAMPTHAAPADFGDSARVDAQMGTSEGDLATLSARVDRIERQLNGISEALRPPSADH